MGLRCGHSPESPADGCPLCRQYARGDDRLKAALLAVPPVGSGTAPVTRVALDCLHRGSPAPPPNGQPTGKTWVACEHPRRPLGPAVCSCSGCGPSCSGYAVGEPDRTTRIDPDRLAHSPDGRRFNCSLADFRGKKLLAYRVGWTASEVHIAELGPDLQPVGSTPIDLPHPHCHGGREDPRLFTFDGRLHLAFAGLSYAQAGGLSVRAMLARLRDDLSTEKVWSPEYPRANRIEKNWSPFECGGRLYAVYQCSPHRVIRLDPITGQAADAFETPSPTWPGGWKLRGGAPPVRVGDRFYHWVHGWHRATDREWYTYAAGVVVFDAKPPFKVIGLTGPVWQPDARLNHLNITPDKEVIYPCGAVLDGGRWLVSAGHQDHECLVGEFDATEIDRLAGV